MLQLQSATSRRWLDSVLENLPELLIDHAHCEKKAASTAMNLLFAYVDREELALEMAEIVVEELAHFRLVLELLRRRGIPFRRLKPSNYGGALADLVRRQEPQRAVDRLLIAGLIEARSCERFRILKEEVADDDLSEFYGGLFESEARHHATYVRLAGLFAPEKDVADRLQELGLAEAEIIAQGDPFPRMHS